jgi:hypothetical protein
LALGRVEQSLARHEEAIGEVTPRPASAAAGVRFGNGADRPVRILEALILRAVGTRSGAKPEEAGEAEGQLNADLKGLHAIVTAIPTSAGSPCDQLRVRREVDALANQYLAVAAGVVADTLEEDIRELGAELGIPPVQPFDPATVLLAIRSMLAAFHGARAATVVRGTL